MKMYVAPFNKGIPLRGDFHRGFHDAFRQSFMMHLNARRAAAESFRKFHLDLVDGSGHNAAGVTRRRFKFDARGLGIGLLHCP